MASASFTWGSSRPQSRGHSRRGSGTAQTLWLTSNAAVQPPPTPTSQRMMIGGCSVSSPGVSNSSGTGALHDAELPPAVLTLLATSDANFETRVGASTNTFSPRGGAPLAPFAPTPPQWSRAIVASQLRRGGMFVAARVGPTGPGTSTGGGALRVDVVFMCRAALAAHRPLDVIEALEGLAGVDPIFGPDEREVLFAAVDAVMATAVIGVAKAAAVATQQQRDLKATPLAKACARQLVVEAALPSLVQHAARIVALLGGPLLRAAPMIAAATVPTTLLLLKWILQVSLTATTQVAGHCTSGGVESDELLEPLRAVFGRLCGMPDPAESGTFDGSSSMATAAQRAVSPQPPGAMPPSPPAATAPPSLLHAPCVQSCVDPSQLLLPLADATPTTAAVLDLYLRLASDARSLLPPLHPLRVAIVAALADKAAAHGSELQQWAALEAVQGAALEAQLEMGAPTETPDETSQAALLVRMLATAEDTIAAAAPHG